MRRLPRRAELPRHLRNTVEHLQNPTPVFSHLIGGTAHHLSTHRTSIKPDRHRTAKPVKDV
jgi:hypothetical protein